MFKAVLFDLDGTLLDIDMDLFIPTYFKKMYGMARERGLQAENLIERMWKSTQAMINCQDPMLTNQEAFERSFFSEPTYLSEEFMPFFDDFYGQAFDHLQGPACSFPESRQIVDEVVAKGCQVAIATQAVFPEVAIRKRLDWAGVGDVNFHLITSYEVMHYTKPHTEYYLEIADLLGVAPEECLMVGNDVGEDLTAAQAGMKTYLVKNRIINKNNLPIKVDWQGYHSDFLKFVREFPSSC